MAERILSEETINAFCEYLVLEEKSTATVEKYLRDVRAFRLFTGQQAVTKERMMAYKKYLMENLKIPEYKADVCVAFARGNVGKAKALAASEEFDNIKNEAVTLLKYIREMEIGDIVLAIRKISEYKMEINDYLDILAVWYRDVLLFKATKDATHLIFKDEIQYIRKIADQSTYEGIEIIIDALEKAKSRLQANVNFDLTMELLLLTIKEN